MSGPVLVVTANPGDEVVGCGGSIANHTEAGNQVRVVHLTSRRGRGGDPDSSGDGAQRQAVAAAEVLGVPLADVEFLRLPQLGIDAASLDQLGPLVAVIRALRPQLVYLPHPHERWYEHRAAFELCWRAVVTAGFGDVPEWGNDRHWTAAALCYEVLTPIGEPSYTEDITAVLDRKLAALGCYRCTDPARPGGPIEPFLSGFRGAMTTGGYREAFAVIRAGRVI